MSRTIDADALIAYCKRCAEVQDRLYNRVLKNDMARPMDLAGLAWFDNQRSMYSYTIPGLIEEFIKENGCEQDT